jgi:hypothetical protein
MWTEQADARNAGLDKSHDAQKALRNALAFHGPFPLSSEAAPTPTRCRLHRLDA